MCSYGISDVPIDDMYLTQSIQGARLSFQSSEMGLTPAPSPPSECSPPQVPGGGGHTRLRERGRGESIRTKGQTDWYSSYRIKPEPVFLNVYGAQESIPRNEFRQPI
jgi:hypothetical protein